MFLCLCIVFKYKVLETFCDIHALIGYFTIRTKNILQCSTQKIITSFARSLLCYVQIYSLGLRLITISFQLPVYLCLYKPSPHLQHEHRIYHTPELLRLVCHHHSSSQTMRLIHLVHHWYWQMLPAVGYHEKELQISFRILLFLENKMYLKRITNNFRKNLFYKQNIKQKT